MAAVLLALLMVPAASADILTNGGFETGDLTGWTVVTADPIALHMSVCGPTTHACNAVGGFGTTGAAGNGSYSGLFGPIVFSTLSQNVSTIAGNTYTLSFWLTNCPDYQSCVGNEFQVSWDGQVIFDAVDMSPFPWTEFTFNGLLASSNSTLVEFGFYNNLSFFEMDDGGPAPVPEPASLVLFGIGMTGLAARLRRKKS